jgi:hypothetical protein
MQFSLSSYQFLPLESRIFFAEPCSQALEHELLFVIYIAATFSAFSRFIITVYGLIECKIV